MVDEQDKPLAGALVALPGHRCTTGAEGKCKFKVLPGRYPLLISKDGYRGRRVNAGVRPGEVTTTRVELQKLPPAPAPRNRQVGITAQLGDSSSRRTVDPNRGVCIALTDCCKTFPSLPRRFPEPH